MMGVRARGPGGIYEKDGAASTRKQRQLRERAEVRQAPPAPRPWATFVRPVARQPSQSDRPPTAAARHLAARQSHPSTSRCFDLALALEPTRPASCVLRSLPCLLPAGLHLRQGGRCFGGLTFNVIHHYLYFPKSRTPILTLVESCAQDECSENASTRNTPDQGQTRNPRQKWKSEGTR
ncbi:hypothetical protein BS50DRAFT_106491 [Corynespora cassiicola Philippines]|uniref:Uncharacterized protein n=1 Tax=Corynespora cassiicola Philippines TaxID=1448308 RepID=A0A2T2NCN0_CORCC|nr:hypothetical protein BS50DRAFT_106491 [Corynespora cassiicola Philippines]